jgi:hypothetical protein
VSRFVGRPARPEERTNYVVHDTTTGAIALSVASHTSETCSAVAKRLNQLDAIRPGLSADEVYDLYWVVLLWQPGRHLETVE